MATEAGKLAGTLSICRALNRWYSLRLGSTSNVSISLISWGTCTNRAMINDATFSLRATVARILTLLPDTCQPGWALRVNITLRPLTSLIWIAQEAIRAEAFGSLIHYPTFCIDATVLVVTWIFTLSVDASFLRRAL